MTRSGSICIGSIKGVVTSITTGATNLSEPPSHLDQQSPLAASRVHHQKLEGGNKERDFTIMRLSGGNLEGNTESASPRRHISRHNIEEDEDMKTAIPRHSSNVLSAPWEHLLSSTISPAAAVAVKMAISEEDPEDQQQPSSSRRRGGSVTENGGLLGTIHRHMPSFTRLSLSRAAKTNGEHGAPLFRLVNNNIDQLMNYCLCVCVCVCVWVCECVCVCEWVWVHKSWAPGRPED